MAITKVVVNDKKEILLNDEWNFVSINVRVATIFRVQGKLSTVFSRATNALKEKETWQSQTLGQ